MTNTSKCRISRTGSLIKTKSGKAIVRVYVERPGAIEDSYDVHFDDFGGIETYPAYRSTYGNTSGSPDPLLPGSDERRQVESVAADKFFADDGVVR